MGPHAGNVHTAIQREANGLLAVAKGLLNVGDMEHPTELFRVDATIFLETFLHHVRGQPYFEDLLCPILQRNFTGHNKSHVPFSCPLLRPHTS